MQNVWLVQKRKVRILTCTVRYCRILATVLQSMFVEVYSKRWDLETAHLYLIIRESTFEFIRAR